MIRVGLVVGVFGIRGAVKVLSLTDFDDRFDPGSELHVDGVPRVVEWSRPGVPNLVVKLRGLETRNDAEALRGRLLEVPESDQRPLPDGAWYLDDLLGLAVVTESGRRLGTITEILERPANDVWLVQGDRGETLVPAVRDAVQEVDLPAGRVTVGDWLLEVEEG
ncbi:MAG: 16S rRNA processing protein RimM [Candidatus Dormibacteraeota bacterium]|nr:16S rRNA processing protein RimM [Candidatus Dormibacteraeota bacterium]